MKNIVYILFFPLLTTGCLYENEVPQKLSFAECYTLSAIVVQMDEQEGVETDINDYVLACMALGE